MSAFFDCRLRKQPREPVCAACDHADAGNDLAQLGYEVNAGRAGRANNRNFHHDGRGSIGLATARWNGADVVFMNRATAKSGVDE